VENQYDVLKQQNDRLSDENDTLRREVRVPGFRGFRVSG
jgi:hypothetical protein